MRTIEAFTPNQLQDIRDFDTNVEIAQHVARAGLDNEASQNVYREHNNRAFELYYSLTRNVDPDGKIMVDGELVNLLSTRMEQRGVKQFK